MLNVGCNEVSDVRFEQSMGFVVISFEYRLLDRAIHALDPGSGPRQALPICPGVVHLGQPVLDATLATDAAEEA